MLSQNVIAGPFLPVVRNVLVERLTVRQARSAVFARGPSVSPVRGLVIRDSAFREVGSASVLEHVEDLLLHIEGPIEVRGDDGEIRRSDASVPYYWAAFQIYGDWQ